MKGSKSFLGTIKTQGDQLESALKNLLGVFSQKRFGEGDTTRERIKICTWNDHVIMLAEHEGASLALRIVPPAVAKSRGKAERTSDAELKKELKTPANPEDLTPKLKSGCPSGFFNLQKSIIGGHMRVRLFRLRLRGCRKNLGFHSGRTSPSISGTAP